MAINLIAQPGAAVPYNGSDYTQQNLLLNAIMSQSEEVLSSWEDTVSVPAIKVGTYFYHSGNMYQTQGSDAAISGTPVAGINYIALTVSGSELTAAYVTDISGYSWNPAYRGMYNGVSLLIRAVVFSIASAYIRAVSVRDTLSGMFLLSDGTLLSPSGVFDLKTRDFITTGGVSAGDVFAKSVRAKDDSMSEVTMFGAYYFGGKPKKEVYAAISPHLPNTGDWLPVIGWGAYRSPTFGGLVLRMWSRVLRLNATTLRFHVMYITFNENLTFNLNSPESTIDITATSPGAMPDKGEFTYETGGLVLIK